MEDYVSSTVWNVNGKGEEVVSVLGISNIMFTGNFLGLLAFLLQASLFKDSKEKVFVQNKGTV